MSTDGTGVIHELKTWPQYWVAVAAGSKPFELRRDDRAFEVGDTLVLREWNPVTHCYSGRSLRVPVTYVLRNAMQFGVCAGFAVLGLGAVSHVD